MTDTVKYWRRGADGHAELLAYRCSGCAAHYLPRVVICSSCGGQEFTIAPLANVGNLYAYTIVHVAPPGYPSPYAIGYVDFPEQVRVFGQISLEHADRLRCDIPVEIEVAVLRHDADGKPVEGYRFAPLPNSGETRS